MKVGVLALQGDVSEHIHATREAAKKIGMKCEIIKVREKRGLAGIDALIIPGGESTTLSMLIDRAGIREALAGVRRIFGTCAGAIMLAKHIEGSHPNQKPLALMDMTVRRNVVAPQINSCERELETKFGRINAVFIRSPAITGIGRNVEVLARAGADAVAAYEKVGAHHYLATAFHPELTTTKFHEFFLKL